ncbi:hypothetical protein [Candidatus Mycoplasma haematominutum]|uniref:Uncharacterized protein n=1 Tax=Candidatus Mycoplasma haematominutum 'Birmingham 1' TaxID=1116213 RepID=G8C3Z4_9MOLU|nr:hypothetical protein [Candidatus Mycoplasma haematominutum]CCE67042.1 hypothetical protein (homolog to MSU_0858) [Candidatus Mycoplasma haematominutum 'Birmingham 1']
MLINTGVSPVFNLGDYALSLVPHEGYFKIDGEYFISSNWNIPDNLIEIKHKLPSQLIDKVFLKNTGRSCNSSFSNLKCLVYRSSSFIDIQNDPVTREMSTGNSKFLLDTIFSINREISHNLAKHNYRWPVALDSLQNQIIKYNLRNNLTLKNYHFVGPDDFHKNSRSVTLELIKKVKLGVPRAAETEIQKVGLYLANQEEIVSGKPVLSIWEISEQPSEKISLRIRTLSGKIEARVESDSKWQDIDLKNYMWKEEKNGVWHLEFPEGRQQDSPFGWLSRKVGKVDVVIAISQDDWTNIIQIRSDLQSHQHNQPVADPLVTINPYDPLLKNLRLDHTWIVEKM